MKSSQASLKNLPRDAKAPNIAAPKFWKKLDPYVARYTRNGVTDATKCAGHTAEDALDVAKYEAQASAAPLSRSTEKVNSFCPLEVLLKLSVDLMVLILLSPPPVHLGV